MYEEIQSLRRKFRPRNGTTVFQAPGRGKGYWIGAPSVLHDGRFLLAYRVRDPDRRGGTFRIAESDDGQNFRDIWETKKEEWNSISLERASLLKTARGEYRLYLSFEDLEERRWRVELLRADSPKNFDVRDRRMVVHPDDLGRRYVKDPYILVKDETYLLYLHTLTKDNVKTTALLTSRDGLEFAYQREALTPGEGWDAYCPRIASILTFPDYALAFYDGARIPEENQEEKTGLARSDDLHQWERVDPEGPSFTSPHGSGSLRYVEALQMDGLTYLWYEMAAADGSHELLTTKLRL